jgi:uncharacterized protein YdhG (YjbR/CyaY superfamily)
MDTQKLLAQVCSAIREVAAEAKETICWAMPVFNLNGPLVYFEGYKHHIGFYAIPNGHKCL